MTFPPQLSDNLWELPELTQINRLPMHGLGRRDDHLSLNGTWKFSLHVSMGAVEPERLNFEGENLNWMEIPVPSCWTMQNLWDKPIYTNVRMPYDNYPPRVPEENPTGVYRRQFTLPEGWADQRVVLHVGGAASYLEIYINGQWVGMSKDSCLPAEFEVTPFLVAGENLLVARVAKWADANYIEDQDQWWHGGITRDVYLEATPHSYLQDVFACGTPDFKTGKGSLKVQVAIRHDDTWLPEGPDRDFVVDLVVQDPNLTEIASTSAPLNRQFRISGDAVSFEVSVANCRIWSAEDPVLYHLRVRLLEEDGTVLDHHHLRTGFRSVEVRDRQLLVNGQAVMIRGINRHEHDDCLGRVMTRARMEADIRLLKRYNFNAVRTSHYPSDPYWYELCDQYGLYVLDEANVETHDNYASLCRDTRWRNSFVERGERMVLRDRNHVSIIGWSLGNESGNGSNHDEMAAAVKRLDSSRYLHHEGDIHVLWRQNGWGWKDGRRVSNDIINPMYATIKAMRDWAATTTEDRPFILCEYAHAMGNSCGSLHEYWQAFEECHGLQGGYIWEFLDHGILQTDDKGRDYWAYGGDFGETIHDANFCADGMVWPDRTPKPYMEEFKKLAQPVGVAYADGELTVTCKQWFTDLSWLTGSWELTMDGVVTARGGLPGLTAVPSKPQKLKLELPLSDAAGRECHVLFRFKAGKATAWCDAGYEVAWEQVALPVQPGKREAFPCLPGLALRKEQDLPAGLMCNEQELLITWPSLCLSRATIDNDGIRLWTGQEDRPLGQWRKAGLLDDLNIFSQDQEALDDGTMKRVTVLVAADPEKRIVHEERIHQLPNGAIRVENRVEIDKSLPSLARVGVVCATPPGFEQVEWFGRGPGESHGDRKSGMPVGRYSGTVDDQLVNYILPQENGNKTDVRWFALSNGAMTLHFEGDDWMEFSVRHFTDADLQTSFHTHELEDRRRPETWIHLDHRQRGVGTGSCGPQTLPEYWVDPGIYEFTYTIRAMNGAIIP